MQRTKMIKSNRTKHQKQATGRTAQTSKKSKMATTRQRSVKLTLNNPIMESTSSSEETKTMCILIYPKSKIFDHPFQCVFEVAPTPKLTFRYTVSLTFRTGIIISDHADNDLGQKGQKVVPHLMWFQISLHPTSTGYR